MTYCLTVSWKPRIKKSISSYINKANQNKKGEMNKIMKGKSKIQNKLNNKSFLKSLA